MVKFAEKYCLHTRKPKPISVEIENEGRQRNPSMASYITQVDPRGLNPLGMLGEFKPDKDMIDRKLYSLIVDERDFTQK